MQDALIHRGPDAEGAFAAPGVALGFRRLAILDLSEAGNQPHRARSRDGGEVVAVVNGEIYNHAALRADLARVGRELSSTNDAEVVPHLYAEYGDAFLDRLDGMFAIAVVDVARRRLLLARDRLGKKPLCWREDGDVLRFASEAKALRAAEESAPGIDAGSIVRFLTHGYVPTPYSAFEGDRRLPPGGRLIADASGVRVDRWWTPPSLAPEPGRPLADWKSELRATLESAVAARLESDVPLGLFLSGGIDSGLVLAAARDVVGDAPLKTFTIGFDEEAYDERALAAATAARFGAEATVELAAPPDAVAALDAVAAVYDEPFGDASAIPTMHVCRLARRHATVVLSGDGGDEPFAGYRRHRALRLAETIDHAVPGPLRRLVARALGETANGTAGRSALGTFRRFASALGLSGDARQHYWSTFFRGELRARMLHDSLLERAGALDDGAPRVGADGGAGFRRALAGDLAGYLPDDLLVKVDLASMAVGLEVRCPWLDPRMIALAARLPDDLLNGGGTKILPRALAADRLPSKVARATKRGFGVPLAAWLRGPLASVARERLLGDRFRSRRILRDGAAETMLDRHADGREDWSSYLWLLLVVDAWARRWIDGEGAA